MRRLAASAYEMDLDVVDGLLQQDENGRWLIGDQPLDDWLVKHAGQELVMVLGALNDQRQLQVRTCRTCGRDYQDLDCPTCRANRQRLRGR